MITEEQIMDAMEKRLIKLNGTNAEEYAACVEKEIRRKYSVSDELAILRQRDAKPEEFAAYNDFVESRKALVRLELGLDAGGGAE